MEKVILDTNILIEILKGNQKTIQIVEQFDRLCISSITVMEIYFGALNKQELKKLKQFVSSFDVISLNENISNIATNLIYKYTKSHTLDIPDALIASTSIFINTPLFTYNKKYFKYINDIELL